MGWMPKSRKARGRLMVVGAAGSVLALAGVLAFFAIGDGGSYFYTPGEAKADNVPAGRRIQLGGMVDKGSVVRHPDGSMEFSITASGATSRVRYSGTVPDLFREGQGVVTKGAYTADGQFDATEVLARHDENYMPRELQDALKKSGEWRGEGAGPPKYGPAAYGEGG